MCYTIFELYWRYFTIVMLIWVTDSRSCVRWNAKRISNEEQKRKTKKKPNKEEEEK